MRPVVELGQLDRLEAGRPAGRPRSSSSTKPPYTSLVEGRPDLLAGDRRGSSGRRPRCCRRWRRRGPSPSTVTSPAGGGGHVGRGSAPWLSAAIQPRSTSSDGAVGGHQRDDHVDAGGAVAGAVADDHGVVGVVRAGGGRPGRHSSSSSTARPGASTSATGAGGAVLVGPDHGVAGLAVGQAVELPLAQPPGGVAEQRHDEREQHPPPAEQEPQRTHASRLSGGPGVPTPGDRPLDCGGDDTAARGPLRPGGHRPAGLADRPVQPALLLLHARRGARLAARRRRCSPTTRWSGWSGSGSSCSASSEVRFTGGEPLVRRGLVDIVRRTKELTRRRDVADDQRARAGPHARTRWPRPGWTGSTSASTASAARHVPRDHPPRPAPRRARRASRPPRTPASVPVKINAVLMRGSQRRPGARAAALGARPRATTCGSSSRCRWTPSTAGAARAMVTADEIFERLEARVRADARPTSRAGAPRPSCSRSTAGRPRSA